MGAPGGWVKRCAPQFRLAARRRAPNLCANAMSSTNTSQRFTDNVVVSAPPSKVFAFYTDIDRLATLLPPSLTVRVVHADRPMRTGSRYEFDIGLRSLPFSVSWSAEVVRLDVPWYFEDRMVAGPFSKWVHQHVFREVAPDRTEVTDVLEVGPARGMLGVMLSQIVLGTQIASMYEFRRQVLAKEFGVVV